MSRDNEEELARGERAGKLLVSHMARMNVSEIEMPVLDDSSLWLVSVRRVGILENDSARARPRFEIVSH
jgi:hypothetical protein